MYLDKIISQATVLVIRFILAITYDFKLGYLLLCYIVVLNTLSILIMHNFFLVIEVKTMNLISTLSIVQGFLSYFNFCDIFEIMFSHQC